MENTAHVKPSPLKKFILACTFRHAFEHRWSYLLSLPFLPLTYMIAFWIIVIWLIWELALRVVGGAMVLLLMALPFLLAIACGCIIFYVL